MRRPEHSKLLAEFIGILLGDGSIGRYRCQSPEGEKLQHRIKITLSGDEAAYAHSVKRMAEQLFSIEPTLREKRYENVIEVQLFNRDLFHYLTRELGMAAAPKQGRARIPEPCSDSIHVLRGYFDTDGSVVITDNNGTVYPRIEMKICPAPMQEQLLHLIDTVGATYGCYDIGDGHVRIQMNGQDALQHWFDTVAPRNRKHIEKAERIAGGGFEPPTSGFPRSYNTSPGS